MKVYDDEVILIGMTYRECTPESAEDGEDSDSGWVWEHCECDMEDFLSHVADMSELDSADWFSTEFETTCFRTGTERQESLHLSGDATARMREIWEAARTGEIDLLSAEDDEGERDIGLPVPFIHLAEFNKVQGKLAL